MTRWNAPCSIILSIAWAESKLTGRPFAVLVRERALRSTHARHSTRIGPGMIWGVIHAPDHYDDATDRGFPVPPFDLPQERKMNLESFERSLNEPNKHVNNLALKEVINVDYGRVDGTTRGSPSFPPGKATIRAAGWS